MIKGLIIQNMHKKGQQFQIMCNNNSTKLKVRNA